MQHNGSHPATTNKFELQRLERIQRNKQVLRELGLENAAQQLLQPKCNRQKRPPKEKQQLQATRKSRRLQGDRPELDPVSSNCAPEGDQEHSSANSMAEPRSKSSRRQLPPAEPQQYSSWDGQVDRAAVEALLQQEPDNPHHMHNLHRLRSMSCKALVTRVRRIANKAKLQSFVKVLVAARGPEDVLVAAEEAMNAL